MSFKLIPFKEVDQQKWLQLSHADGGMNLFYHPAYLQASSAVSADWQPTHVLVKEQDEQYVLGLALKLESGMQKGGIVEIYGFRGADHIEPIRVDESMGFDEAISYLIQTLSPSLICGNSLTEPFADALIEVSGVKGFRKANSFRCLYTELPANEDEFLARYSSNFRGQIRRKAKKAAKSEIEFRWVDSENIPEGYDLSQGLDNLVRLHGGRFKELGKSSKFLEDLPQTFYGELCRTVDKYPSYLSFMEAVHEGQVVGSFFGVRNANRYNYIISGFDEAYNQYSLGRLLIFHTMKFLMEKQVGVFDFIRGTEEYKFSWTEVYNRDYNVLIPFNLKGKASAEKMRWRKSANRKGRLAGTVEWLKRNDK